MHFQNNIVFAIKFDVWYTEKAQSKAAYMALEHSSPERLAQPGERRGPAGISFRKAL